MIPENIRKINRPKNTIVSKTSKEGLYPVRNRLSANWGAM